MRVETLNPVQDISEFGRYRVALSHSTRVVAKTGHWTTMAICLSRRLLTPIPVESPFRRRALASKADINMTRRRLAPILYLRLSSMSLYGNEVLRHQNRCIHIAFSNISTADSICATSNGVKIMWSETHESRSSDSRRRFTSVPSFGSFL